MERPHPPIVTLLTDFGTMDSYVAEMKGRVLSLCPQARLVDISHHVAPQDIEMGAYILACGAPAFPRGTIHIGVVDPGVGSGRRGLVVETGEATLVGPDNGLFSPFLDGARVAEIVAGQTTSEPVAPTFHGRDLFAPAAARLARGEEPAGFCRPLNDPVMLPASGDRGRILHVDRFGNCITSFRATDHRFSGPWVLQAGNHRIDTLVPTYSVAPPGTAVLLAGSGGYLEIAVRQASAAKLLNLGRETPLRIETTGDTQ